MKKSPNSSFFHHHKMKKMSQLHAYLDLHTLIRQVTDNVWNLKTLIINMLFWKYFDPKMVGNASLILAATHKHMFFLSFQLKILGLYRQNL